MRKRAVTILCLLALLFAGALFQPLERAWTAPGAGYRLSWWTVDGGGGPLAGGGYTLNSTAGQFDARLWQGGNYTLAGGFWRGLVTQFRIHLPMVIRD